MRILPNPSNVKRLLAAALAVVATIAALPARAAFLSGEALDKAADIVAIVVLIVVPVTAPVIIAMGIDPVWLGVMIGINLQTAFLTPPVGFALFYMRAVAPASITTGAIYRGIIPFVGLQVAAIALLWWQPQLATWLPKVVFPDAVPASTPAGGQPGSVLDDILKSPSGAAPAPAGSPLDQLLTPPAPSDKPSSSDPVLDRLLNKSN